LELEFNKLHGDSSFAHIINYLPGDALSYGLNKSHKMVSFYFEKDVTPDMKYCDVAKVIIPDDARVVVTDGKFMTDKLIVKMFVTRLRFSQWGFSFYYS
jgi:hypothetical protein